MVLLDDSGRVLLLKIEGSSWINLDDPDVGPCWIAPGGGVDDGEAYEAAVRRECWEETGIDTAAGPCVWTTEVRLSTPHGVSLLPMRFYLARVAGSVFSLDHLRDVEERAMSRDHRWWTVEEIRASKERFAPRGVAERLAPIVNGTVPSTPIRFDERRLTIHMRWCLRGATSSDKPCRVVIASGYEEDGDGHERARRA